MTTELFLVAREEGLIDNFLIFHSFSIPERNLWAFDFFFLLSYKRLWMLQNARNWLHNFELSLSSPQRNWVVTVELVLPHVDGLIFLLNRRSPPHEQIYGEAEEMREKNLSFLVVWRRKKWGKWIPFPMPERVFWIEIFTSHSPIARWHSINRNFSLPFASFYDRRDTFRLQLTSKKKFFCVKIFSSSFEKFSLHELDSRTVLEGFPTLAWWLLPVVKRKKESSVWVREKSIGNVTSRIHALFRSFQMRKLLANFQCGSHTRNFQTGRAWW